MAISFERLRPFYSQFNTDNIKVLKDKQGKIRGENIPCHLVITQNDTPDKSTTVGAAILPVVVYAEIYTGMDVDIYADDTLTVEKRDKAGNILATYKGVAGVSTTRQSRKMSSMQITEVEQVLPPEPPAQEVQVDFSVQGAFGPEWYTGGKVKLVKFPEDRAVFTTGWIFRGDGSDFVKDGVFASDGMGGTVKVLGGSHLKAKGDDPFEVSLTEAPVCIEGVWSASVKFIAPRT